MAKKIKKIMAKKIKSKKTKTKMMASNQQLRWLSGLVMGLLFVVFLFLPHWWQLMALLAVVFVINREWQKLAHDTATPLRWAIIGFFYILIASVAAGYLLILHPLWFLQTLLIVMAADIGGYLVGKKWGRRKLAPAISPGKTWEGVFGGFLLVGIVVYISAVTFHSSLGDNLLLSIVACWGIAMAGVLGDLFASYFKRCAGAKDFGNIIPGHGGMLDRIDGHLMGLLIAATMAWLRLI